MVITAGALLGALVFLIYAPICLISLRWLIPRLAPTPRLLALVMLAAQILFLALGLQNLPRWDTFGWLVHLDQEWNIPSTFASVQLALAGAATLMAALLANSRSVYYRLYLVAIGILFLIFAWDEYYYLHEDNMPLKLAYVAVSGVIGLATIKMALRSPPRARLWQFSLMAGMMIYFFGAVLLEPYHETCIDLGFIQVEGCMRFYNLEEALEFIGVWLVLVAGLGVLTDETEKLSRLARLTLFALPVIWLVPLVHNAVLPRLELRFLARPAMVHFESGTQLLGYRLEWDQNTVKLWLYPSAWRSHYSELGFSVHLVDQATGESAASRNIHSDLQFHLLQVPGYAHVYRQLIVLDIPAETPRNRAYWVTLSYWRDSGAEYEIHKIVSSDHKQLGDAQVLLDELVLSAAEAASAAAPLAVFDEEIKLSAADIPERARRGESLPIRFDWSATGAGSQDLIQFLHLGHQASGEWWVYDQQPLGARLPTRLWYSGLRDSEIWQVPLPADLAPGQYEVFTGLYRQSDFERIPASDADGAPYVDARVPLSSLIIQR